MKIKSSDEIKIGDVFYYANYSNPNLPHQESGVSIIKCIAKKQKEYGFGKLKEMLVNVEQVLFVGKNDSFIQTTMEYGWITHRNFYRDINEARREAVVMTFENYKSL